MKRKLKYILLVVLLSSQFSCGDWVELYPNSGLIKEEFWKTKEDVTAVLMGAYQSFAGLNGRLFLYGELRADMIDYDISVGGSERNIMEGNIYPTNYLAGWDNFYKVINYCNEVIKNAPLVQEIDNTYTDYQRLGTTSEAYFLRSMAYFYLVRIFKDVPLILEPTESDNSELYYEKMDGEQVLQSMLTDLEQNRQYAPSEYSTEEEYKGRATKAAFDALIADIALWLFDYEKCIEYVQNIEQNEEYQLQSSIAWFDLYYPGNTLEGIFEFQFDQSNGQSNGVYGVTNRNSYTYDPSQKALEMFAFDYGSSELVRGEQAGIKKYGEDDYIIWKYVGRVPDGNTTRSGTETGSANWIVYRLADVLLMKAEALSQLERYQEAQVIINTIRERAGVPPVALANSKIAYEDAIMEERALEFAFEGKRYFDLLRMGRRNNFARKSDLIEIIIQTVPSTQKRILATKLTDPNGWYMPIHEDELEKNIKLVQNPYYKF